MTVNGGTNATGIGANGRGDVLVEARGNASDVVINATVKSGTGHVTFDADRSIDIKAAVSTGGAGTFAALAGRNIDSDATITTVRGDILLNANFAIRQTASIVTTSGDVGLIAGTTIRQTATGDITTSEGDVLIDAGSDWTMHGDANITAGGQQVLGLSGGTITLGVISVTNALENHVALSALNHIVDANAESVNIEETVEASTTTLSLRSTTGTIGQPDGANGADSNTNALDLHVDTVAAASATGIYLREIAAGGDIKIDTADAVRIDVEGVVRSNFSSTTTDVSQDRLLNPLEDLTTISNGPIKLVAENGTITINSGTAATVGIRANGVGDVLIEARNRQGFTGSNVILNASIVSGTGHITLDAADDLDVNASVSTGADLTKTGTIYITASNNRAADVTGPDVDGVNLNGQLTTTDGDVLIASAGDIRQAALITSTNGDVGLIAANNVTQTSSGHITTIDGDVLIDAGRDWTMAGTTVVTAGGQQVLGTAGRNIVLGVITVTDAIENHIALNAGGNITDGNASGINIQEVPTSQPQFAPTTTLSLRAGGNHRWHWWHWWSDCQ